MGDKRADGAFGSVNAGKDATARRIAAELARDTVAGLFFAGSVFRRTVKEELKNTRAAVSKTVSEIREDVNAVRERDPAASSDLEVLLLYSGFHAVLAHRAAHVLHKRGHKLAARAVSQAAKFVTGVEIHPAAKIGRGLFIDHGSGVVIGETAEIGDNCTIYQGATLGGTGKDTGKRHPTLGNNVMVGAGAKVLGPFSVGDNSKIAANAVVLKAIPANSTAVGIPARVVAVNNRRVDGDLDQIHIPDPVAQELTRLEARIAALEGTAKTQESAESENGEGRRERDAAQHNEADNI